jgi:hypothetical protein
MERQLHLYLIAPQGAGVMAGPHANANANAGLASLRNASREQLTLTSNLSEV